jgi:UDP-3-O-acyl N-acetylglucosamine deacetylase
MSNLKQQTIKKEISISGTGLHTGKKVNIKFIPAKSDSGINFIRTDLPGRSGIKADLRNVSSTVRGTNLAQHGSAAADGVNTIEHVLSALFALSITNLDIKLDAPEPPSLDGSSKQYCELMIEAGIAQQGPGVRCVNISKPVIEMSGDKCIIALPSDRFTVSFMINYPLVLIGTQYYELDLNAPRYIREIAPARTYGFMDELETLKKQGLALGANSENAVAIGNDGYMTELRFKDELVRHKILDLIGDLSLLGARINGRIISIRSGHDLNIRFAKKLLKEVG